MAQVRVFGGVDEVGGNKVLVEDGDSRAFLDFGMSFGKVGAFFAEFLKPRTNGALRDLLRLGVLPRLDGVYRADACALDGIDRVVDRHGFRDLWCADVESYDAYAARTGRPFVDGVVLTHAHLDHFGHFGYLDPAIPIHCTAVTAAMLRAIERVTNGAGIEGEFLTTHRRSIAEHGARSNFPGAQRIEKGEPRERPIVVHRPYEPFDVGRLRVTLVPVDHSVPGAASVLVETRDGKRLYYTGDVRFHGSFHDVTKRLRETVRDLRPDVMLTEGTRVTDEEPDDERGVGERLREAFDSSAGLAMVDFGWKDTCRFETVQRAAQATGRELVVGHKLAYLARKVSQADPSCVRPVEAYGNVRVYQRRMDSMLYSDGDYNGDHLRHGYWDREWRDPARDEALAFAHTRSGNARKAVDVRRDPRRYVLAVNLWEMPELLDIDPPPGSTFTRAACEPYDDEMEADLARQANWLKHWGVPVKVRAREGRADVDIPQVAHASGHACGPHLLDFVRLVAPRRVVPIHTQHADAFEGKGLGAVKPPKLGEPIPL